MLYDIKFSALWIIFTLVLLVVNCKMNLSNIQQYLLSYFNLVNLVSLKSALRVFEEILHELGINKSPNEKELLDEIGSINLAIRYYDLEIVEAIDEITSENLIVLIHTADNLITHKLKFYNESTIKLFLEIIKDCIFSEQGYISETHCLNLSMKIGIPKSKAVSIIERLVKDKWLSLKSESISLSMRSILELEQNLKQFYSDEIKYCPFCKLIIVQGYNCSNCQIRSHNGCIKKYLAHSKGKCICPNCKTILDDFIFPDKNLNISYEETYDNASTSVIPTKKRKKN